MKKIITASLLLVAVRAAAFSVEVSQDAAREVALTVSAIATSRKSLRVNIYELKSAEIVDALQRRIEDGIHVEILEEGQPVGGLKDAAKALRDRLVAAMGNAPATADDHFYVMTSKEDDRARRRFHFDHAKYVVVDGERLLIGSENYSGSLHPTAAHPGNRGWQVLAHSPTLASAFDRVFTDDSSTSFGDIHDLVGRVGGLGPFTDALWPRATMPAAPKPKENETLEADAAERILSPESLDGLVGLLDGAQRRLDLQLMTFSQKWGATGKISPLYAAVLSAARRGVTVRVLLNDSSVFAKPHDRVGKKKDQNAITVAALNAAAKKEGLELQARVADVKAMKVAYIHNKGALVDDDRTLVSSINWNQNSVEKNREAALVLTGRAVHDYYQSLFDADWEVSR